MKNVFTLLIAIAVSFSVYASDFNKVSLQGESAIIEMAGAKESGEDSWLFEGDKFYQVLGGRKISPDKYKVVAGLIDLGYSKIKVKSFDGNMMEVNMAGFSYKLKKK